MFGVANKGKRKLASLSFDVFFFSSSPLGKSPPHDQYSLVMHSTVKTCFVTNNILLMCS